MTTATTRTELEALVDDLLHAVLGAPEDDVAEAFEDSSRALLDLRLSPDDRFWVDAELQRIAQHFDLR